MTGGLGKGTPIASGIIISSINEKDDCIILKNYVEKLKLLYVVNIKFLETNFIEMLRFPIRIQLILQESIGQFLYV